MGADCKSVGLRLPRFESWTCHRAQIERRTPDESCEVTGIVKLGDRSTFGFQPLLGGLSPEAGWKSLELLKNTMWRLKAALDSAGIPRD